MPKKLPSPSRIEAFDYLRGFFILIILVDHLWLWPNIFGYLSGEGRLWVTAAEGFVIISGLLVGYIRGYKNRRAPWSEVAAKLLKRAGLLYIWGVITTLLFTATYWLFFLQNEHGPMPYVQIPDNEWGTLVQQTLTLSYAHIWTFFLHLYAIFLVLAVPVVVLLRKSLWWLVGICSVGLWVIGVHYEVEWLTWQALFFLPAIVGYYLEPIRQWFGSQTIGFRRAIKAGFLSVTGLSILLSALVVFHSATLQNLFTLFAPQLYAPFNDIIENLFNDETRTFAWVVISFIWFSAFYILFQATLPWLKRWLGWLLEPFGTRSLTAYILHGVPMFATLYLYSMSNNMWINSFATLANVLVTWALLQPAWLQKVIPR